MIMLDHLAHLYEKFGACTSDEDRETVAKEICLECSMAIWKTCDIAVPQIPVFDADSVLQYYDIARQASKVGKSRQDESERAIITFYASALKEKSLWLSKRYGEVC